MGDPIFTALRRYAVFTGRSHRKKYLWFLAFCFIASRIAAWIDRATGAYPYPLYRGDPILFGHPFPIHLSLLGPVSAIVGLVLVLPLLTVQVRRLHDADRSARWLLCLLLPLLGGLLLLSCSLLPGTEGSNRYGPDPRA